METGFPSVDEYVNRLPNGLASYPHLKAKASILRGTLSDAPFDIQDTTGLPASLADLIHSPPSSTDWIKEVELWGLASWIFDRGFRGTRGLGEYEAWRYQQNKALFTGPLYRILFAVASPERLLVGFASRYAAFHHGTVVSQVQQSRGAMSFRLTTPPHVLPLLAQIGLRSAFRAGLDLCGAKDVKLATSALSPEVFEATGTWR